MTEEVDSVCQDIAERVVDMFGIPIPGDLQSIARACVPFPLVVGPVADGCIAEVLCVQEVESRYNSVVF